LALSILELVAQLKSNKEIFRALEITPETVKSHIKNIPAKLPVRKRMQAAQRAEAADLIRRSV
jgi:LuxR family maltose regulon positive regulatory protein